MSNKTVITVSSVDGVRQFDAPGAFKSILLVMLVLIFISIGGIFYYVKSLSDKVAFLTLNNEILTKMTQNSESIYDKYENNKKLLVAIQQEKRHTQDMYHEEKIVLEKRLTAKIDKLTVEKETIKKQNKLTLTKKNENDKLLDALAKEIINIEKELEKETKHKERLQKKLSLKVKLKKEKIQKSQKRKASLLKQKLKRENLLKRIAKSKLGKRYVWGAIGPGVFDCSGFTSYVYKKAGVNIPRTSIIQAKYGKYVKRKDLQAGDLIFFDTSRKRKGYVNHVGIYLGNNKFIHASSAKKKVVITSLNKPFYSGRYKWARRVH